MIIEGLLTTLDDRGQAHVAPMGPRVNALLTQWTLRPYQSSTTFQYLRRDPRCIFHVIDDVLPLVQCVLNMKTDLAFDRIDGGWVIRSACHWYQLQVHRWDVSQPRSEASASVIAQGYLRPFWGWNRAKHAILEATILVTRLHILEKALVESEFARLQSPIDKTSGPRERQAWHLLSEHLKHHER